MLIQKTLAVQSEYTLRKQKIGYKKLYKIKKPDFIKLSNEIM